MKTWFLPFVLMALLFLSGSCRDKERVQSNPLNRLNWSEKNFGVLNNFINDYGAGGRFYDEKKPPYAVLDWDQTCAHFDVEEALMRYQLVNLRYKMTKEQFAGLLKDTIHGLFRLPQEYQGIYLADINRDLKNGYNFLHDNFLAPDGTITLGEVHQTPQFHDFFAKLIFLYDAYCSVPDIGDDYAYPWVLYLFTGHTTEEVKAMACEAISHELGNRLGKQTVESPASLKTGAGVVKVAYRTGLRVIPEMQDLISTFRSHHIDVFIVSASYKPVVEMFAGMDAYGYNVPSENVIAMELETTDKGKILPEYKAGWVKTFGQGKVEAICNVIKERLGKEYDPVFSAGDSDGDYEMSTGFPGMKLSLIWDRGKSGKIGTLCKQAMDEMDQATPRYILQGRDENAGIVIPFSESVLLKTSETPAM
ncbi:MAG: HAD family hydrolase [Prolixibacteraceae bacterium]|jgi:phosphoserine phosphatase|nr:HAD family hydrolase [Prolixibacteraceae bacterium]